MTSKCFHCNEVIPTGINLSVEINHIQRPMCCIGCQAIAQTIQDNGLTQYYAVRTEPAHKGQSLVPEQLQKNKLLDEAVLQSEFVFQSSSQSNSSTNTSNNTLNNDCKEAILTIDGISCAACAWLIEMQLDKLKGLISISVNATTQRATVKWQDNTVKLSNILTTIENIGYQAMPFKANDAEINNKKQSKAFIKRLGISGILMMQIMMIAVGLYFGAFADMTENNKIYLRWISFLLSLPIIFYGAFPFYIGAINAIKAKRLSMDVPVSIAIILAFSASAWATITQQGEVYFESVSMFTFLLLIGKFLEFRARSRAAQVSANLLKLMPMTATKLVTAVNSSSAGEKTTPQEVLVAAKNLSQGDMVIIKPGEVIPADGIIISGLSQLNEAMLSGEQVPISKTVNDKVFAGTINGDGNITVQVTKTSSQSFLSQLIRLSEESQAHKPKIAQLSDKIAQYFVAVILLTSIATALYWHQHMPEEAFWITLSVLVATCPCALSLATPTGLTCATTRLNKAGIMIKGGHVMETIPSINCFAFDKTGTLTTGEFTIERTALLGAQETDYSQTQVLAIAAALEAHSEHPIAKPFAEHRDHSLIAEQVKVHSGQGVSGTIDKIDYVIGKYSWLTQLGALNTEQLDIQGANCILIANKQIIAAFYLIDKIRDEAFDTLTTLNKQHKTLLLSGDSQLACDNIAQTLPLNTSLGGLSAQDKMQHIKAAQAQGDKVAMTGDGVNDSPVFGAAHVSIAMGCGADITKSGADVILLNNKLSSINTLIAVSHRTRRIILQNYLWAFGYNAIVLPLAVTGHITPYLAVIGMSASSILVIVNSLRLLKE